MTPEIARTVAISITALGAVAWLAGLAFTVRIHRERHARAQEAADRFEVEPKAAAQITSGEAELEGRPDALAAKLTERLARDGLGPLGQVKIVSSNQNEVVFETAGSIGQGPAGFRRGWARFAGSGSKTRVEYAIETKSGRVLLALALVMLGLGFVALAAGAAFVFAHVVPSPDPSVRIQSVQMVQVVHFLWPPFLFAQLARQPGRMVFKQIEALVHNLPYT
jgi:hypothetical protein